MSILSDLTADITRLQETPDLTPELLAEQLISAGWTRTLPVLDTKKLAYGTYVEVLKNGDWTPGRFIHVGPGNLLEVDTERGPWSGYAGSKIRLPQT